MAHVSDPHLVQLLSPAGRRVEHPEATSTGGPDTIAAMYRDMLLARRLDTEAFALQRHGELGLWPPARGQEGVQVGTAHALREQDMVFATYRDHGVAWVRGIPPERLLALYRGTELGGWDPATYRYALPAIVIGAQTLHAAGYAMGLTFDGVVGTGDPDRDAAVVVYLGDGATSQGDTHEALDWAAVFGLPLVFVVENNQYAISAPVSRQAAVPIVDRALGFGIPGVRVDGNDVLACRAVAEQALARAREGQGATLIEAVTYRVGPHTTSDDATRYRDAAEVASWAARDPLDRVRAHLESLGQPPAWFTALDAEADALGEHLRAACVALPVPDLADLFDHVTVDPHPDVLAQRDAYVAWREEAS